MIKSQDGSDGRQLNKETLEDVQETIKIQPKSDQVNLDSNPNSFNDNKDLKNFKTIDSNDSKIAVGKGKSASPEVRSKKSNASKLYMGPGHPSDRNARRRVPNRHING